ncbi:nucleotidyltransferase family protein [Aureibaculum luteum]|uniref:nucleotidyltransferase family protein n=1 Tax=Aureibaculum luteum TaxID=1548456 RepID=UPI000E49200D|nr:nucleotidyltransferase family protein [Aureibaculum luteum]
MKSIVKPQNIAIVILAAGASSRMKSIKQLLPWKKTTLLGNAIQQGLLANVITVYVVLGANSEVIRPEIKDFNIEIIENESWELGMGKSIACAMNFINNSPTQFDGILITLADQPLLMASHYNKMIGKFTENSTKIIATKQDTTIGVPAIFSRKHVKQLVSLNEDKGAKAVIKKNMDDVLLVDTNGITVDADTMNNYKELYEKYGR